MAKASIKAEFNLDGLTGRDMAAYLEAEQKSDVVGMATILAKCCTSLTGTEQPMDDAKTFSRLPVLQWRRLITDWRRQVLNGKADHPLPGGVEYDLDLVTAEDFGNLVSALRRQNVRAIATALAGVVTRCPADWGDPRKVATWMGRRYFAEMLAVISAVVMDVNDSEKKESLSSSSG